MTKNLLILGLLLLVLTQAQVSNNLSADTTSSSVTFNHSPNVPSTRIVTSSQPTIPTAPNKTQLNSKTLTVPTSNPAAPAPSKPQVIVKKTESNQITQPKTKSTSRNIEENTKSTNDRPNITTSTGNNIATSQNENKTNNFEKSDTSANKSVSAAQPTQKGKLAHQNNPNQDNLEPQLAQNGLIPSQSKYQDRHSKYDRSNSEDVSQSSFSTSNTLPNSNQNSQLSTNYGHSHSSHHESTLDQNDDKQTGKKQNLGCHSGERRKDRQERRQDHFEQRGQQYSRERQQDTRDQDSDSQRRSSGQDEHQRHPILYGPLSSGQTSSNGNTNSGSKNLDSQNAYQQPKREGRIEYQRGLYNKNMHQDHPRQRQGFQSQQNRYEKETYRPTRIYSGYPDKRDERGYLRHNYRASARNFGRRNNRYEEDELDSEDFAPRYQRRRPHYSRYGQQEYSRGYRRERNYERRRKSYIDERRYESRRPRYD